MTLIVKGTLASECRTMFWPTRFTYSVINGSSINLAWRSTSAAASRPCRTSFSVEPLIFAMIPVLMFLLPIMAGSSLVDKGLPDLVDATAAVAAGWAFFGSCFWSGWVVGVVVVGSAVFGLDGCPITVVVCAATALANSEVPKTRAGMAREKLVIAKNLQNLK